MKRPFRNNLFVVVLCFLLSGVFVYFNGQADIPNKGSKTNIFSFQDLDYASKKEVNVVYDGWPLKYNKTFYKSDPTDSCYICNKNSSIPCTCGMPSQIYYSQINWPLAILDFLIVVIALFLLLRVLRLLRRKPSVPLAVK
ncbi:MAG: hypothetical protein Q8L01_00850 [Candidatus Woesebacteria bacterium]|nr:hypothetical protein [Candidatus Woesebacteria bacterium]